MYGNKKDYDYLNNLWDIQFWINEKCSKYTKNHQIFKNMGNLNNFCLLKMNYLLVFDN